MKLFLLIIPATFGLLLFGYANSIIERRVNQMEVEEYNSIKSKLSTKNKLSLFYLFFGEKYKVGFLSIKKNEKILIIVGLILFIIGGLLLTELL